MKQHQTIQPTDLLVGQNIRKHRERLCWSRDALAASLVPPRDAVQVLRYESGRHRISATYLYQIAQMMKVDMESFFKEDDNAPTRHE